MDNHIDNDIKNHIRQVFDNFEDPTADEGWLLLRERYPEKKRRAIVWLWWGAAAVLLLLIGIQFFKADKIKTNEQLAFKPIKPSRPNVEAIDKNKESTTAVLKKLDTAFAKGTIANNTKARNSHSHQNIRRPINNTSPTTKQEVTETDETANPSPKKNADTALIAAAVGSPENPPVSSPVVDQPKATQSSVALKPASRVYNSNNSVAKKTVENANDQKVRFGVFGATFVNYTSGGAAKINAGGGITSDIKVGKNISLSTGVALAQNSFNYGSSLSFGYADPSTGSGTGAGSGSVGKASANTASLISLDIPVNFKFGLNPSGNTFISTGLSSGTFITETYSSGTGQQSQIVDSKNFGNFYFARILNFSFGTTLPIGKTNNLIIEPFIKYPLGGLGEQQIKFGAGGINLKFNLQPLKK